MKIRILPLVASMALMSVLTSCVPDEPVHEPYSPFSGNGFWFVNEGGFNQSNGSLAWFSYDSLQVTDDIFLAIAGRKAGDIPQSVAQYGDTLFLVVNNSSRIEVIDIENGRHIGTIDDIPSPRSMILLGGNQAAVSSLGSDSLTIVDIATLDIERYINTGGRTESLHLEGDMLFAAHWAGGSSLSVVSVSSMELVTTIPTAPEPCSIARDANGMLRVLCSGGYFGDELPSLVTINPATLEITGTIEFPGKTYPSELVAGADGEYLYYLDGGVYRIESSGLEIPSEPFIAAGGRSFYRLGFDIRNNRLVITDAVDYVQKGYLYIYDPDGSEYQEYETGINPGRMMFPG